MHLMRLVQLRVLTVAGLLIAALSTSFSAQADCTNTNTCLGTEALPANAGSDNTAIGYKSLLITTANSNTGLGSGTLRSNSTGTANTATGYQALFSNETASE